MEDYHQFHKDMKDAQELLCKVDSDLNQKYSPDFKDQFQIELLLQELNDQKKALDKYKHVVWGLQKRGQQVVPLRLSSGSTAYRVPEPLMTTAVVAATMCYSSCPTAPATSLRRQDSLSQMETKVNDQKNLLDEIARREQQVQSICTLSQQYQQAVKDYEIEAEKLRSLLDLENGRSSHLSKRARLQNPTTKVREEEVALTAKFTEVIAINRERLQNLEFALNLLRLPQRSQESDWEEISVKGPNGESSMIHDRKSGRKFSIEEALQNGRLTPAQYDCYVNKDMSIQELAVLVSGQK
ncbi:Periplakin [Manis javanica]|nr:Periplakin [Manis javanica]